MPPAAPPKASAPSEWRERCCASIRRCWSGLKRVKRMARSGLQAAQLLFANLADHSGREAADRLFGWVVVEDPEGAPVLSRRLFFAPLAAIEFGQVEMPRYRLEVDVEHLLEVVDGLGHL